MSDINSFGQERDCCQVQDDAKQYLAELDTNKDGALVRNEQPIFSSNSKLFIVLVEGMQYRRNVLLQDLDELTEHYSGDMSEVL